MVFPPIYQSLVEYLLYLINKRSNITYEVIIFCFTNEPTRLHFLVEKAKLLYDRYCKHDVYFMRLKRESRKVAN